jgi:hypothetical protein
MQYFRDTVTGGLYAFEDNVSAIPAEGGGLTFIVDGEALPGPYPATLEPTDDITPPPYVPTAAENAAMRDTLVRSATDKIAPLQDMVEFEMASDADVALLKVWKLYRINLSRLDLHVVPVDWPEMPS